MGDSNTLPVLPPSCWRSGFTAFRDAYSPTTEASDSFLWASYLVAAGMVLGRNARLKTAFRIYPNLYAVNVGESGSTRKSTAQAYARDVLEIADPKIRVVQGVGSAEGFLTLLGVGASPQRVLIHLNELSTLLRKGGQDATRTLLPFITEIFDCPPKSDLIVRNNPITALQPFLGIHASTTRDWLLNSLSVDDVRGGLAGRFIYIIGHEKPPIPWPSTPDEDARDSAIRTLIAAKERHEVSPHVYDCDAHGHDYFSDWYIAERSRTYDNELRSCLSQRFHVHAWKVAIIFAALEGTPLITGDQMRAACAFADYQREAQAYVFENLEDEEKPMKAGALERRILKYLKSNVGTLSFTDLRRKLGGSTPSRDVMTVITSLQQIGMVTLHRGPHGGTHISLSTTS